MVGALIIVLHAPEDKEVTSIDELLVYALRPGKCSQKEPRAKKGLMMAYNRIYELLCYCHFRQFVHDLQSGAKVW